MPVIFLLPDDHEHEQQANSLVTYNVNIELYICANELQLVHLIHWCFHWFISQEPDKATEAENSSQRKTKGVAKRNQNYSGNEDETLISAYLNVSKDQVVGINQQAKSYWQKILDYYNEFRTTTTTRTWSSQHRWGEIQWATTKFCGFYDEIERKNKWKEWGW
jgi:hypothetical protein